MCKCILSLSLKCFRAVFVCMSTLHLEVGEFVVPDPRIKYMDPDHDTGNEA
jgi:hypothetical protein